MGLYAIMSLYHLFCFVLIDLYNDFGENYLYNDFYVDYFPLNYWYEKGYFQIRKYLLF